MPAGFPSPPHRTLKPPPLVLSGSWGKPFNTRASLRRVRPGSPAFHTSAANEVSKSQSKVKAVWPPLKKTKLLRDGSPVGQITSDIKPQNNAAAAAVVWLWRNTERSEACSKAQSDLKNDPFSFLVSQICYILYAMWILLKGMKSVNVSCIYETKMCVNLTYPNLKYCFTTVGEAQLFWRIMLKSCTASVFVFFLRKQQKTVVCYLKLFLKSLKYICKVVQIICWFRTQVKPNVNE